jgi:poly-gamma-glutamate synthesis protein (capsule biosynthesis protein)
VTAGLGSGAEDRGDPTVAIVGDCIASRPLAPLAEHDEGFEAVVELLRRADAAIGNLETAIVGLDAGGIVPWGVSDDWAVRAEPGVAADLRAMGFDAFGLANNHAMDWGVAGLRGTRRHLDAAGLIHAGAGEDASRARAPAYVETPRGRVGLVSATTSPSPVDVAGALDPFHGIAGRPGVHALGVRTTVTTDPANVAWLRGLRAQVPELSTAWTVGETEPEIARTRFTAGDGPGVSYEVDERDLAALLRSVRLASQHADVAVLALHVHQGDRPGEPPPPFLRGLARASIDAGADVVAVSGPHRLGPVELHAGRPILYGLGDFIWSDLHEPLPRYFWERTARSLGDAAPDPEKATDADLLRALNADAFDDPEVFRGVIAVVTADALRLHPVELGYGEAVTRSGIPRGASAALAEEILEVVAARSAPLGTELHVAEEVGTVRLGP